MSRTRKDRPIKIQYPDGYSDKQDKPKRARFLDTEWHWISSTPSWWTHLFMCKPQRRASKLWEREVNKSQPEDIDDLDTPNVSNKPHKYYY